GETTPPVLEAATAIEKTSVEPLIPAAVEQSSATKRSEIRRWAVILAISNVLIAAALGGYYQWSRSKIRAHAAGRRLMLAVLPFENLTCDAGQEYFSDGLTEEMIAQLGRLEPERLGVIARTSVMQYKSKHDALERIGSELGVQYVLEGSVRRDTEKIRISAQLIQMKDQTHLWVRQYD